MTRYLEETAVYRLGPSNGSAPVTASLVPRPAVRQRPAPPRRAYRPDPWATAPDPMATRRIPACAEPDTVRLVRIHGVYDRR